YHGRNRWHGFPVILAEKTEINLGKGIALSCAAYFQNSGAGAFQYWMVGLQSHQLQRKISFHRGADVGRAIFINWPAAIFILMAHDLRHRQFHAAAGAGAEKRVYGNVIGFQRGIGFQFAAPVAILMLKRKQAAARGLNSFRNAAQHVINFSKKHLCGIPVELLAHGYSAATAGAACIASTISGGRPKRTFSGMTSTSSILVNPLALRNSTACSTSTSGADAPAVSATVCTPLSHSGLM